MCCAQIANVPFPSYKSCNVGVMDVISAYEGAGVNWNKKALSYNQIGWETVHEQEGYQGGQLYVFINILPQPVSLCIKSYHYAITRSYTVHLNRKMNDFLKINCYSKNDRSLSKMSGIFLKNVQDPRSQDPAF